MKKAYVKPCMYVETFIAEQYVAASACGTHITKVPPHGHLQYKDNMWHCAFTTSNCGPNATSCVENGTGTSHTAEDLEKIEHEILTSGAVQTAPHAPDANHNCHVLDTNEAAKSFANDYRDSNCKNGVLSLMGLQSFEELEEAWS